MKLINWINSFNIINRNNTRIRINLAIKRIFLIIIIEVDKAVDLDNRDKSKNKIKMIILINQCWQVY